MQAANCMSSMKQMSGAYMGNFTVRISRPIACVEVQSEEEAKAIQKALLSSGFECGVHDNRISDETKVEDNPVRLRSYQETLT